MQFSSGMRARVQGEVAQGCRTKSSWLATSCQGCGSCVPTYPNAPCLLQPRSTSATIHTGARMENTLVRRCPFSVKGVLPTVHSSLGSRGKPRQLCTTVRASPLRPAKSAQLLPEVRGYDDESSRLVSNDMASTSGTQDVPGEMSFSATRSVLYLHAACAGAFLLSAGSASAMELSSQVSWLPVGSMHDRANFAPDEAAELAELLRVPEVSLSPFQVLTFLLQHPLITLGVAAALYFLVPRLFRALVRYLVVPLALALALYVVSLNPAAATSFAQGSFNCAPSSCACLTWTCISLCKNMERAQPEAALLCPSQPPLPHPLVVCVPRCCLLLSRAVIVGHPVETSAVIIVALAFALSPYILVLGAVLVLVTGVPSLPPFLRPVVPAPVLEVHLGILFQPFGIVHISRLEHRSFLTHADTAPRIEACAVLWRQSRRSARPASCSRRCRNPWRRWGAASARRPVACSGALMAYGPGERRLRRSCLRGRCQPSTSDMNLRSGLHGGDLCMVVLYATP